MTWFTPNTSATDNYYDKARYLLIWRISLAFTIIFSLLAIIYLILNLGDALPALLMLALTIGGLIYLRYKTSYVPLFWVYCVSGTLIIHFAINTMDYSTHYVDFLWMIVAVLLAYIGLGSRYGLVFIIINGLGIGVFYFFSLNTHIEILKGRSNLMLTGDYVEISLVLFIIAYLLHQHFLFNDYTRQQLTISNEKLESQNQENVVLLKEVHHRVKNNLQIITSLLRLQKSELSPESEMKFDEAIGRIMTMSLIHQKLYQEAELSKLVVKDYIIDLLEEIKSAYQTEAEVSIEVNSSIESIGLKTIVPFGLMLNELASNSFKHAFKSVGEGKIIIQVDSIDVNKISLKYYDTGIWKSPKITSSRFGIELIETLTEQLDGAYERTGSTYEFQLTNIDT